MTTPLSFNSCLLQDISIDYKSQLDPSLQAIEHLAGLINSAKRCQQLLGRLRLDFNPINTIEEKCWNLFESAEQYREPYQEMFVTNLTKSFAIQSAESASGRHHEWLDDLIDFLAQLAQSPDLNQNKWTVTLLEIYEIFVEKAAKANQRPPQLSHEELTQMVLLLLTKCQQISDPAKRLLCAAQSSFFQHFIVNLKLFNPNVSNLFRKNIETHFPVKDLQLKEIVCTPFILNLITNIVETTVTVEERAGYLERRHRIPQEVHQVLDVYRAEIGKLVSNVKIQQGWELINRLREEDGQLNCEFENKCRLALDQAYQAGCRDRLYINLMKYLKQISD